MTEELKIILELFNSVTDAALIGGISYLLIVEILAEIIPWVGGYLLLRTALQAVPKFKVQIKEKEK